MRHPLSKFATIDIDLKNIYIHLTLFFVILTSINSLNMNEWKNILIMPISFHLLKEILTVSNIFLLYYWEQILIFKKKVSVIFIEESFSSCLENVNHCIILLYTLFWMLPIISGVDCKFLNKLQILQTAQSILQYPATGKSL